MSGYALLKHMILSRICLTGCMYNMRTGFIGWYGMQRTCISGRHVVVVVMFFMRICVRGGHV